MAAKLLHQQLCNALFLTVFSNFLGHLEWEVWRECPYFHSVFLLLYKGILQLFGQGMEARDHKVLIYIEHHSVCPLVGIGTLPPPLSPASVPRGTNSPAGEGLGESQLRRREKSLVLSLFCGLPHY
jgi:hypothetical protein